MNRIKQFVWGSKKRRVTAVVAAFFATTSVATATLFILYTGLGGSGQGTFATSQNLGALTISIADQPVLGPGDTSPVLNGIVANNDTTTAHGVVPGSLTATFSSVPSQCAAHLSAINLSRIESVINDGAGIATIIPPGSSRDLQTGGSVMANFQIALAAAAPATCADGTWSVAFAGTTS